MEDIKVSCRGCWIWTAQVFHQDPLKIFYLCRGSKKHSKGRLLYITSLCWQARLSWQSAIEHNASYWSLNWPRPKSAREDQTHMRQKDFLKEHALRYRANYRTIPPLLDFFFLNNTDKYLHIFRRSKKSYLTVSKWSLFVSEAHEARFLFIYFLKWLNGKICCTENIYCHLIWYCELAVFLHTSSNLKLFCRLHRAEQRKLWAITFSKKNSEFLQISCLINDVNVNVSVKWC